MAYSMMNDLDDSELEQVDSTLKTFYDNCVSFYVNENEEVFRLLTDYLLSNSEAISEVDQYEYLFEGYEELSYWVRRYNDGNVYFVVTVYR